MDGWGDEIDMISKISWYAVFVASKMVFARVNIGVGMVFCSKQELNLLHSGVEFDPASTLRKLSSTVVNPMLCKPRFDRAEGVG